MHQYIGYLNEKFGFKIDLSNCKTGIGIAIDEPNSNSCEVDFRKKNDKIYCLMTSSNLDNDKNQIKLFYEINRHSIEIAYWPTLVGVHRVLITNDTNESPLNILVKERSINCTPPLQVFDSNIPRKLFQSPVANRVNSIQNLDIVSTGDRQTEPFESKTNKSEIESSFIINFTPNLTGSTDSTIRVVAVESNYSSSRILHLNRSPVADRTINNSIINTIISSDQSIQTFDHLDKLNNNVPDIYKFVNNQVDTEQRATDRQTDKTEISQICTVDDTESLLKRSIESTKKANAKKIQHINYNYRDDSFGSKMSSDSSLSRDNNLINRSSNHQQMIDQWINPTDSDRIDSDSNLIGNNLVKTDASINDSIESKSLEENFIQNIDMNLVNKSDKLILEKSIQQCSIDQSKNDLQSLSDYKFEQVSASALLNRENSDLNRKVEVCSTGSIISENELSELYDQSGEQATIDSNSVRQHCIESNETKQQQLQTRFHCSGNDSKETNQKTDLLTKLNCLSNVSQSIVNSDSESVAMHSVSTQQFGQHHSTGDQQNLNNNQSHDQIVFRKKKPQYSASNLRATTDNCRQRSSVEQQPHHFKKSYSNLISNSNLNARLERKNAFDSKKNKRSSLEPFLDGIDPNRKSIDNLFYKLYCNQVNGDELTDREIANVYRKNSINSMRTNDRNSRLNDSNITLNKSNSLFGSSQLLNSQISQDEFNYLISCSNKNLTQNLTKNLSKISSNNLNDDFNNISERFNRSESSGRLSSPSMISDDSMNRIEILNKGVQSPQDVTDGCRERIESRRKIFQHSREKETILTKSFIEQPKRSPEHKLSRSSSKVVHEHANSQFKFIQNSRSKKKIGQRRVTPLYSNYDKESENQVDEIFIILKEDENKKESTDTSAIDKLNCEPNTHLIYDSFEEPLNSRKSSSTNVLQGLAFNTNNESVIDLEDESTSLNRSSLKSSFKKLSSTQFSSSASSDYSSSELNKTEVDDHGILPVQVMVKHWTDSRTIIENDTKPNKRATVHIPNCSIKNKRAIFEQRASSLDDKENKPKNSSFTNNLSFRKKQLTVWSDEFGQSNEPKSNVNENHSTLIRQKLNVNNQLENESKGNDFKINERNNECEFRTQNQVKDLTNHQFDEKLNSSKDHFEKSNGFVNGKVRNLIHQSSFRGESCGVKTNDLNRQSINENGFQTVNVKQKKSFWESLSMKKMVCKKRMKSTNQH